MDGESVSLTLPEFLADNETLWPDEVDAIRLLAPGETFRRWRAAGVESHAGGGAMEGVGKRREDA